MVIAGINPGSHESSACLCIDGDVVVAIEEERLSRTKGALGQMPHRALMKCLSLAKLPIESIDYIAIGWKHSDQPDDTVDIVPRDFVQKRRDYYVYNVLPPAFARLRTLPQIAHVGHHLSHAASVVRTQRSSDTAVLVVDGQGDTASTAIYDYRSKELVPKMRWDIDQSLGYFYQAATRYLGFPGLGSEGKTMGLAAYGKPTRDISGIGLTPDGYFCSSGGTSLFTPEDHVNAWRSVFERLQPLDSIHTPARYAQLWDSGFSEQHIDFASSVQAALEKVIVGLGNLACRVTGAPALAIAGGVALNCSANRRLCESLGTQQVTFSFAPGDSGAAIGAALELHFQLTGQSGSRTDAYLGPEICRDDTLKQLVAWGIPHRVLSDPVAKAAELIGQDRILGWCQGRMEFGPRALGNRSILANPQRMETRNRVNRKVKGRELWRPFSPVMLTEFLSSFGGKVGDCPFMSRAVTGSDLGKAQFPAVIHVDSTARVQTVGKDSQLLIRSLLEATSKASLPVLLNTSLNSERTPIACSARDAVEFYFSSGLDDLIVGDVQVLGKKG